MSSISPENWQYIPFGLSVDQYGGKSTPIEEFRAPSYFAEDETSRGFIRLRYVDGNFNVLAEDLGINLLYDQDGKLETIGVDLLTYYGNMAEDDLDMMGGDVMNKMMETMLDNGDRIFVSIELKDKSMAVANINETLRKKELFATLENLDFSLRNLATVNYDGFTLFVGVIHEEDEFLFGVNADYGEDGDMKQKSNLLIITMLTDFNYKTFLDSKAEDRLEKLAQRVFFV